MHAETKVIECSIWRPSNTQNAWYWNLFPTTLQLIGWARFLKRTWTCTTITGERGMFITSGTERILPSSKFPPALTLVLSSHPTHGYTVCYKRTPNKCQGCKNTS